MWPAFWLYDCNSGKQDASELDVLELVYNAPLGQKDDPFTVYQYDHGPAAGRTLADPGGLDARGGWWQPYGSLSQGDPGSDPSKRWTAYSVWWQTDRESKYVDNQFESYSRPYTCQCPPAPLVVDAAARSVPYWP